MASHIAGLYYETYEDLGDVAQVLQSRRDEIQVIVAGTDIPGLPTVSFGDAQRPGLSDYADGVDTLAFLTTG